MNTFRNWSWNCFMFFFLHNNKTFTLRQIEIRIESWGQRRKKFTKTQDSSRQKNKPEKLNHSLSGNNYRYVRPVNWQVDKVHPRTTLAKKVCLARTDKCGYIGHIVRPSNSVYQIMNFSLSRKWKLMCSVVSSRCGNQNPTKGKKVMQNTSILGEKNIFCKKMLEKKTFLKKKKI